MLTLAFPYTSAIAGDVQCYTLTPELANAWDNLARQHGTSGRARNLPYADLSQAFRFVLGDFAAIRRGPQGNQSLLMTRREPPDGLIPRLFGEFERDLARRHDRPFQNQLAPLVTDLTAKRLSIAEYLDVIGPTGEPDVPSWVYDVATWHAIELLSARPLVLPNGRHLTLRADTDGNLLAWDDLLPDGEPDRRREPAMHYISLKPITVPGQPGLVLSIDAHVSRLTYFFPHARKIWLATDSNRLVLTQGIHYDRSTRRRTLKGIAADLVDSFSLRGIPTVLDDDLLTRDPERVRARYQSTPTKHAVGSGPGRKFLDAVLKHALACLPDDSRPLELSDSKIRVIDRPTASKKDIATPGDRVGLAETLRTAGQRLDLTVLFATDETRARAVNAIAAALDVEPERMGPPAPVELVPGHLRVGFTHASKQDILTPGPDPAPRRAIANSVAQDGAAGWVAAVLAETDSAAAQADGAPTKHDPKRQARRELARHGIVSQFLDTASAPKPGKVDYPATSALHDLLRTTGMTGTVPGRVFDAPLTARPAVLVGIYSREQNKPSLRVISLSATVTDGTDAPWTAFGYHPDAGGWRPYPTTTAAHHATTISPFDAGLSYTTRTSNAATYAYRALDQLLVRFPDLPVVLFVDGVGCRNLWPGLANRTLGLSARGALPHLGLANASDQQIGLVRVITNDDGGLFQAVRASTVVNLNDSDLDELVPASTKLYRLSGGASPTYYLVNRSRTDQAHDQDVRASHRKTRFDIADNRKTLAAAWHAMTCTEFSIIDPGDWTADQLAALSARLCGHPLVWDGRTSRPTPLHLARQVIQDHPERT